MRHFDPRQTAIVRACMERHIAERLGAQRRDRLRAAGALVALALVSATSALAHMSWLWHG